MRRIRVRGPLLVLAVFLLGAPLALAQTAPITLTVDASTAARKFIRTTMVIPVKPGPLTLYYPKWIPGEHAGSGPIANVTGLKFTAAGRTIPWTRDLLDGFTFHLDVPPGADRLEATFDYLEPGGGAFTAGASATDKLAVISWNQNLLYPAGTPAEQLSYAATLVLPPGWKFGTPLAVASQSADRVTSRRWRSTGWWTRPSWPASTTAPSTSRRPARRSTTRSTSWPTAPRRST